MVLVDRREFWLDRSGSGPVLLVDVEAAGWNVWESLQQQDTAGPNWERCFSGWFLSGEPNQTGRAAATRPWLKCDLWPQSSSWISNAADELFDWPGPVRFCSFWMWAGVVLMLRRQPSEVHHPGRIGPVLLSTFGPGGRFWRARRPPGGRVRACPLLLQIMIRHASADPNLTGPQDTERIRTKPGLWVRTALFKSSSWLPWKRLPNWPIRLIFIFFNYNSFSWVLNFLSKLFI